MYCHGTCQPRDSATPPTRCSGLLDRFEPATPYQLKQIAQVSIFHFWSIPHTQLYTECARLAEGGPARRAPGAGRPAAARLPPLRGGAQSAQGVASGPGHEPLRTARSRLSEAVLRRRPGRARRDPARAARAAPALLSGADPADRHVGGDASRARGWNRPRAGIHPLLVATSRGSRQDRRAPGLSPPREL